MLAATKGRLLVEADVEDTAELRPLEVDEIMFDNEVDGARGAPEPPAGGATVVAELVEGLVLCCMAAGPTPAPKEVVGSPSDPTVTVPVTVTAGSVDEPGTMTVMIIVFAKLLLAGLGVAAFCNEMTT